MPATTYVENAYFDRRAIEIVCSGIRPERRENGRFELTLGDPT
jgi:hypothetical protein